MLRRSPALLLFFFLLFSGSSMLGVGDPGKEVLPSLHAAAINWEAVGAVSVIGMGFLSGTWFVVSMAMMSSIRASEAGLRAEFSDPAKGFVTVELCKTKHWDTERRVDVLEDQLLRSRGRQIVDQREDNRRLDKLEDRA
jgi:hypothetical protein